MWCVVCVPAGMQVSPWQIYTAAMDWFEHLSRPPSDPAAGSKLACLAACRSASLSDGGRSERMKSTFYGPSASEPPVARLPHALTTNTLSCAPGLVSSLACQQHCALPSSPSSMACEPPQHSTCVRLCSAGTMAAAVAAAAATPDVEEEQQWQQQQQTELDDLPALRSISCAGSKRGNSHTSARHATWRPRSVVATDPGGGVDAAAAQPSDLRLGSTVTAASVSAAKAEALQRVESGRTAEGTPVYSVAGSKAPGWEKLYPSISGGTPQP